MHIINYPKLIMMFSGNAEKVELLIAALKKRIPEWLLEAEEVCASKNPETIRSFCHRIRGAAGTITAERLEDAAARWGAMAKENPAEDLAAGHADLARAMKELAEYTQAS
jgi:HPt (histidine-containing phosphotransfer) domain-containing protein